jgi:hypothetical protein
MRTGVALRAAQKAIPAAGDRHGMSCPASLAVRLRA